MASSKGSKVVSSPGSRIGQRWEALRASFGFLSGLAMVLAVILGVVLPALDDALQINLPVLSFDGQSSARSLLETIGTATVAVAGVSFSITVVAFTLASSQLSPRVLRNFRRDRLSQTTLAFFLGTFVYSLVLLVRLGVNGESGEPPNVSLTLAVLFALVSFATFAAFIAHIISMLQPSSIIASIGADGTAGLDHRYPGGPGDPEDPQTSSSLAGLAMERSKPHEVEAETGGYLTVIHTAPVIEAATEIDGLVRQRVEVGTYVVPGQVIAEFWGEDEDEKLLGAIRDSFSLEDQRTLVQDIAFPIRQLADIALKGLSPGINDPTTAENAMEALSEFLIEFCRTVRPCPVRVGEDQQPRFIAVAPELDDLVRLGFSQVRVAAGPHPSLSLRMLDLIDEIERSANREAVGTDELSRQRRLIGIGSETGEPTEEDMDEVRDKAGRS